MFSQKLHTLKSKSRYRSLSQASGIDLSSNDYLGLKDHPSLKQAAIEAIKNGVGLGSGGSRLLRGNAPEHVALEEFAASHYGFERALYFPTGYAANYALWSTLPSRHDVIIYDALMHACAKDGFRSSPAKSVRVSHNDLNAFEDALKRFRDKAERLWISVESVYSMDGDFAPLKQLYELAVQYGAILVVDEAHGTGVFGEGGRGLVDATFNALRRASTLRDSQNEDWNKNPRSAPARLSENVIVIHTCGKALGGAGGVICADNDTVEYLINTAMPFVFSTAPPPLQAYMTQKAIELCASETGDQARQKLFSLMALAKEKLGGAGTQIVPIILGDDQAALEISFALQDKGYDIRAIRPPSVPEGTARLRLSLGAHIDAQILNDFISQLGPYLLHKAA